MTAFLVGAVVSLATSWLLVTRLERIGERFGLSEALLGLAAALAADTPEITASVTALSNHERTVGAGVVLGSNVFNLAALLGLGAVVAGTIVLHRRVVLLGGAVAVLVALVCLAAVTGALPVGAALGLVLVVLVPYILVLGAHRGLSTLLSLPPRWSAWIDAAVVEEEQELEEAIAPRRGRPLDIAVAAVALVVVVTASVAMERGASVLGRRHHVAEILVGGLVLAAVTSLPNAVAAVYLAAKGRGAATWSTALNSNTLNVVVGLLIPGAILGLARPTAPGNLIAAWCLGLTVLTVILAYAGRGLRRWAGTVVILAYAGFVAALLALA